jgi:hypothetical protein
MGQNRDLGPLSFLHVFYVTSLYDAEVVCNQCHAFAVLQLFSFFKVYEYINLFSGVIRMFARILAIVLI